MEIAITLLIVVAALAVVLTLKELVSKSPFLADSHEYITAQSKYQALVMGVALLVLVILYFVNAANFSAFAAVGDIAAPVKPVSWLGLSEGESWLRFGASLTVSITLATFTFVYLQFRKSGGSLKTLWPFLPWVMLFALSNSLSEEIVCRLGVIVPLAGVIDTDAILLISAILFGLPHYRGMPNGIVGVLMAGFLGWLLAKSVVETNGIFWAWFIHFLQDVVIYSAFVLTAANKLPQADAPQAACA